VGQKETIVLVQTNLSSVIGAYTPDQWEDTTNFEGLGWIPGNKDITSGSPFLFYWVNDEIEIIEHKDDKIPMVVSNTQTLMEFVYGLRIKTGQNEESLAYAWNF